MCQVILLNDSFRAVMAAMEEDMVVMEGDMVVMEEDTVADTQLHPKL